MAEDDASVGKAEDLSAVSRLNEAQQLRVFKSWFRDDSTHSAEWRSEAKKDFDFVAGRQWDAEDEAKLAEQRRPAVTFNRCLTIIKAVAGVEINGRHEVHYLPRGTEDTAANEVLNAGSRWMGDQCDAEDEESEAFQHALICGMGVTENRLAYDDEPDGKYVEEAINPREFYWDKSARKKGLKDARRMWRVRKILIDDARERFPDALDSELDAVWALGADDSEEVRSWEEKQLREEHEETEPARREVVLAECQWWEKEAYWYVGDPATGKKASLDEEQYTKLNERLELLGLGKLPAVKLKRKVYKRAFIGSKVLRVTAAPCTYRFSWAVITGEPDHEKGTWYGLVRVMRDPQTWANKFLSQTMHIMNSSAKGGIMAETDAFEDTAQAEDTYAQPDAITWVQTGAISGGKPKIMPKPMAQLPAGYYQLLEFAISSIRDVTGINLELLGLRDANQPGILEAQRKQAAMTVLATMFDALRFFRKQVGRIRLHYMQKFLADGRLMRVVGPDGEQATKRLTPEVVQGDYDVIVDDAPTSPNQKQENWGIIQSMLPYFKQYLTPEVALIIMEYSPLPTKVTDALRSLVQKGPDPQTQKRLALQDQTAEAKIARDEAGALQSRAAAIRDVAEAEKTRQETQTQALEAFLQSIVAGAPQGLPQALAPALPPRPGPASGMPSGLPPVPAQAPDMPAGMLSQ